MPSSPHPFKTRAPYHSRVVGLEYRAFGTDPVNPPFPTTFGCLSVNPTVDFNTDGPTGGPFAPDSNQYVLTNIGGSTMSWTLTIDEVWLVADVYAGDLTPGDSITITVTLDADTLPAAPSPYTAVLTFVNTTNGCGNIEANVSLSVS